MPPGLVIWDCDGVLVDSERLVTRLDAEWITALGWPLTQAEVVARFVGRSEQHMAAEIERSVDRVPAGWFDDLRAASHQLLRTELTPVDGVIAAMDALDAAGVPMCVASSSDHDRLRLVLGQTGLLARFGDRIHSATDVGNGKPAPDLFLRAAAAHRAAPADCVVVEDSVPGVTAGVAAGMRTLGFTGGLTPADRLREAGAEAFGEMAELPALLGVR